ncbi:MAG: phospholipid carrier-dependent glycosyltransferase [Gloeocapsa sp. DLM2.Bin57]|nr:MAG: phospholipid carrier-dependent glycosyltransferase [Gloeocapsa sp. DLM2.Bin57]
MTIRGILLWGLLYRLLVGTWLTLSYDEFYYYLYSRHLDWSYFDHPILVALTTGFTPWLTGIVSPLSLRFGTIILYTGSLYLLYLTGVKLFGSKAARLSVAIASIIPIFQIAFGILTLPDGPLIFFWSASLYCAVWQFFPKGDYTPSYRLLCLAVLVGLACLSKYHGFILALGLLGFVLFSPQHRCILLSRWGWLAIGVFFLTISPIWIWNYQNDWVSFRFHLSSRFQADPGVIKPDFSILKVLIVFLANILYLFPSFGIPLNWVIFRSIQEQFKNKQVQLAENLILWVSLPLIIGFTLLGGKQQVLAAWPMAGYWGVTLLLGKYAVNWSAKLVERWLKYSAIAIATLMVIFLLHLRLGILQKPSQYAIFGGILTPETDTSTEMFDVKQLTEAFRQSPFQEVLTETDFVFTNAWYLAGQIYLGLKPVVNIPVTTLGDDMRGFAFWYDTEDWVGKNALYITLDSDDQIEGLTAAYSDYFAEFKPIGRIPIYRGQEIVKKLHVYQGKQMLRQYPLGLR